MQSWLDRLTMPLAPRWTLKRVRARVAADLLVRHYEAAAPGRRTQGWRRSAGDANAVIGGGLAPLRDQARDLVRNNPYAKSALRELVDDTVGWGIVAAPKKSTASAVGAPAALRRWKPWAETTACDANGRHNFYGLQRLAMREVSEAGEVLVRRRWRRPADRLPIPMQLQLLEADYLDTLKDGVTTADGGRIIQGVQFDQIGRRTGYWLFPEHPGSTFIGARGGASQFVPAAEILHIFDTERAGQVRGPSWLASVTLRMKDLDEYEDATLLKQKIAACLAAFTTDLDGTAPALGATQTETPNIDYFEPGMIVNAPPGRSVTFSNPPAVNEYTPYTQALLRAIAVGIGTTYEGLTGDYTNLPFSAARMSRLRHWARIHGWRWHMLIPQLCDPVWAWAMQAAAISGLEETPAAEWTAPPMPMVEPDKEGLAYQRNLRIGATTWPEMVRERGFDPEAQLAELAEWNRRLDAVGVILDSDPRKTTQAGQPRESTKSRANPNAGAAAPSTPAANGNGARHR